MKKLLWVSALIALAPVGAIGSSPHPRGAYHIDKQEVYLQLLGSWENLLVGNDFSPDEKRILKGEIYRFLFQCWMANGHDEAPVLEKERVRAIIKGTAPYVQKNDPMKLDRYYEGDQLSEFGKSVAAAQLLADADQIFASRKRYHEFVARFLSWTDSIVGGPTPSAGKP